MARASTAQKQLRSICCKAAKLARQSIDSPSRTESVRETCWTTGAPGRHRSAHGDCPHGDCPRQYKARDAANCSGQRPCHTPSQDSLMLRACLVKRAVKDPSGQALQAWMNVADLILDFTSSGLSPSKSALLEQLQPVCDLSRPGERYVLWKS